MYSIKINILFVRLRCGNLILEYLIFKLVRRRNFTTIFESEKLISLHLQFEKRTERVKESNYWNGISMATKFFNHIEFDCLIT